MAIVESGVPSGANRIDPRAPCLLDRTRAPSMTTLMWGESGSRSASVSLRMATPYGSQTCAASSTASARMESINPDESGLKATRTRTIDGDGVSAAYSTTVHSDTTTRPTRLTTEGRYLRQTDESRQGPA